MFTSIQTSISFILRSPSALWRGKVNLGQFLAKSRIHTNLDRSNNSKLALSLNTGNPPFQSSGSLKIACEVVSIQGDPVPTRVSCTLVNQGGLTEQISQEFFSIMAMHQTIHCMKFSFIDLSFSHKLQIRKNKLLR